MGRCDIEWSFKIRSCGRHTGCNRTCRYPPNKEATRNFQLVWRKSGKFSLTMAASYLSLPKKMKNSIEINASLFTYPDTRHNAVYEIFSESGRKICLVVASNATLALESAHHATTRRTESKIDVACDYTGLFVRNLCEVPTPMGALAIKCQ